MAGSDALTAPSDLGGALQALGDRLTALEQTSVIPVGIVAYCAGAVPNGWLALDGSTFSATRYGQLSAYLGGGTTLPNAQGKVIASRDAATFATLLGTGGVETVTLTGAQSGTPVHAHPAGTTGAGSAHSHGPGGGSAFVNSQAGGGQALAAGATLFPVSATTATESAHTHPFTTPNSVAANAAASHTNLAPYIVLIAIIKF